MYNSVEFLTNKNFLNVFTVFTFFTVFPKILEMTVYKEMAVSG
jgi:hypothetical protein